MFQIQKTREITSCDAIVSVMSGNFVQRGEPAIIDKWSRTKMALNSGIDLVLELPVIYSLSSAEFFAQGAISILHKLGVINNISFGSEYGKVQILQDIAKILSDESSEYKKILKDNLKRGNPYPYARSKAVVEYTKSLNLGNEIEDVLSTSNNILGIEYCKSLIKIHSLIKPFTIKRQGSNYNNNNLDEIYSSATAIRTFLKSENNLDILKRDLPEASFHIIKDLGSRNNFVFSHLMYPYLRYKLFQHQNSLKELPDTGEGLHNRIINSIGKSSNYEDLISNIKTKRYTYTRISRILCQYFIGFEKFDTKAMRKVSPSYVKILGFNTKGAEVLKEMKKKSEINVYTKLPPQGDEMLDLDLLSTRMYSIINPLIHPNADYLTKPIIYL